MRDQYNAGIDSDDLWCKAECMVLESTGYGFKEECMDAPIDHCPGHHTPGQVLVSSMQAAGSSHPELFTPVGSVAY